MFMKQVSLCTLVALGFSMLAMGQSAPTIHGAVPSSGVIGDSAGNLYGTTSLGGSILVRAASPGLIVILSFDRERERLDAANMQRRHFVGMFLLVLNPGQKAAIRLIQNERNRKNQDCALPAQRALFHAQYA
jgi:hypothetical protein